MTSSQLNHRNWSHTYDSHIHSSPSSSPPCSSSPPTSPLSATYSRPHIAPSSPYRIRDAEFDSYYLPSRWPSQIKLMDTTPAKASCKLPSFRSMFGDLAPSTSSDVEYSDSGPVDWEKPDRPSSAMLDSVFYSDSEEEEENDEDDETEALDSLGSRFQTSDERGRWKQPLPPTTPAFRQRHSEPTTSRPVAPLTKRIASEPVHHDIELDFIPESRGTSYDADLESELQTSDGGAMSSPDMRSFSSLPPSSPPLSPKSIPVSPDLGPVSESSPLSDSMSVSPSISSLALTPLSPAIIPLPSDDADVVSMNLTPPPDIEPASLAPPPPIAVGIIDSPESPAPPITCSTEYKHVVCDESLPSSGPSAVEIAEPLAITVKVDGDDAQMAESQCSVLAVKENDAKRRKSEEPAPRKKARTIAPSTSTTRKSKDADENSAIAPKRRSRKSAPPPQPSKPAPRRRRRQPSFSSSSSDSDADSGEAPPPPIPKLVMSPEDLEICGMIIETMATSRASTHSASSLYKSVMTNRPALQRDWNTVVFARVLEDAHGQNGIFGKVESSGMDDSDRPLEAQWFYVPERDEDQDRAALVRSLMPRPAKRSVTKKYKQYYYRPLGKISRWDDEDAL